MRGSATSGGRLPAEEMTALSRSEVLRDSATLRERNRRRDPGNLWGLGVARVLAVDATTLQVTLRVVLGAPDDQPKMPVVVPMPMAGRRHLLGGLPEVGDYAVVGWIPQESLAPRARTPVIVGWMVPGVPLGLLGARSSMLSYDDADLDDDTVRGTLGADAPARYRFLGVGPGDLVGSSASGADMVIGDGFRAVGQGGSEVAARGDDDSVLARGVTIHEAAAGVRVYAGPARRDALLPPFGVVAADLPEEDRRGHALDELVPAAELDRGAGATGAPLEPVADDLDPYAVWGRAGWGDAEGRISEASAEAVADPATRVAGRRRYRLVPVDAEEAGPEDLRYAEWRVEAAFEARPLLPMTEVADGIDAERLPSPQGEAPPERPAVRLALGTAVGNDPWGAPNSYGKPLRPRTRTQGVPDPRVEAGGDPEDLAAFLLEVDAVTRDAPPCFVGVDRSGRLRASLAGTAGDAALDLVAVGRGQMSFGGDLRAEAELGVELRDRGARGVLIASDQGPVVLQGAGPGAVQEGPSLRLEAVAGDALLRAADVAQVRGATVKLVADSVQASATQDVNVEAGGRLATSCSIGASYYSTRREELHGGNKGPLHARTYKPALPGQTCEKVTYEAGDREETFKLGSHTTTIQVGSMTYQTELGAIHLRAVRSRIDMDATGIKGEADVGFVTLDAKTGPLALRGTVSADLTTSAGSVTVSAAQSVYLGARVKDNELGPIISAGSLDPLTGLPFATWGMGSPYHTIGLTKG